MTMSSALPAGFADTIRMSEIHARSCSFFFLLLFPPWLTEMLLHIRIIRVCIPFTANYNSNQRFENSHAKVNIINDKMKKIIIIVVKNLTLF